MVSRKTHFGRRKEVYPCYSTPRLQLLQPSLTITPSSPSSLTPLSLGWCSERNLLLGREPLLLPSRLLSFRFFSPFVFAAPLLCLPSINGRTSDPEPHSSPLPPLPAPRSLLPTTDCGFAFIARKNQPYLPSASSSGRIVPSHAACSQS